MIVYTLRKGENTLEGTPPQSQGECVSAGTAYSPTRSPLSSPVGSAARPHVTRTSVETMATPPDHGATQRTRKLKWNFAILIPVLKSSKVIKFYFFKIILIWSFCDNDWLKNDIKLSKYFILILKINHILIFINAWLYFFKCSLSFRQKNL